jgi:hypothetical protein
MRTHKLSAMLFGQPLNHRCGWDSIEETGEALDCVLRGAIDLLGRETGADTPSFKQAKREWDRILASDYDFAGIAARRAALLFALHTLAPVRTHFAKDEPLLVADLEQRVLPTTIPSFINGMAQKPDSLVVLVSMLCTAWKEDLGCGY